MQRRVPKEFAKRTFSPELPAVRSVASSMHLTTPVIRRLYRPPPLSSRRGLPSGYSLSLRRLPRPALGGEGHRHLNAENTVQDLNLHEVFRQLSAPSLGTAGGATLADNTTSTVRYCVASLRS